MTRFILPLFGVLAALILAVVVYVAAHRVKRAEVQITPIVNTAVSNPPAWRLFAPCPVMRRNIPTLPERRA